MRKWMVLSASVALAGLLGGPSGWAQNDRNAVNGAPQPAPRNIQMVPAKAELQKSLNAKKLKPGQTVTAKLEQTVNLPDEPALKRNTVLVGHVDTVQASQHHSNSRITVTFDQAKLKSGQVLPVKVTIMAVAEPQMAQGGAPAGAAPAEGMPAESAEGEGGRSAGGSGAAPAMPAQQQEQPGVSPGVPPAGAVENHQGIPGVMLESSIHQPASATFLSKGRNVEVPGGTEMQLAIAIIPKGVKLAQ